MKLIQSLLFIILLVGNVFNLGIGRVFAFFYAKLGELPQPLLIPMIMLMAIIGSYAFQLNPYDVVVMLVFGLIGFGMRVFGIPEAPMVITFLIAPMAEESIRKALLISGGDWLVAFFHSPLAIGLFSAVIILTLITMRLRVGERLNELAEKETKELDPPTE